MKQRSAPAPWTGVLARRLLCSGMSDRFDAALYGSPSREVIQAPPDARQVSPLSPGAADLGEAPPNSLDSIDLLVPPGAAEARHVLAQALVALRPGGRLTAAAPKDKGGMRLKKLLQGFGASVDEVSRRHHRICTLTRPEHLVGLSEALAAGAPRQLPDTGLWSQPGVFSWDRLDPGSALLMRALPDLKGQGADIGCGIGWLAQKVLASANVSLLHLIDVDRRAVECARRNVDDPRARFAWADARRCELSDLDFIVTNPPFHDAGTEDRRLGQDFIRTAAGMLRKGGLLWLVANRHLPYEAELGGAFRTVRPVADQGGYKVYEAVR
jgi:16S rRNA (guanine1207-N2)-methyltransferase